MKEHKIHQDITKAKIHLTSIKFKAWFLFSNVGNTELVFQFNDNSSGIFSTKPSSTPLPSSLHLTLSRANYLMLS